MKKQAELIGIFVFLIFIIVNRISAEENSSVPSIILDLPDEADSGEEFDTDLTLNDFSEDIYDVRIDILDNNSSRIARIWNGESWQSTYYYVNDAIDTSQLDGETFQLNITSCYNGNSDIEIKIRDSKGKSYVFSNYSLNITGNCNVDDEIEGEEDNSDEYDDEISLSLDWNGEMKNREEFEIEVMASNLEDKKYDIKIYIYDDNENKPMSQVYYDGKWKSSTNYISEFFEGPGDESETVKLRIKDSYRDFSGDAIIGVRIREHEKTAYVQEMEVEIEILEAEEEILKSSTDKNTNRESDKPALQANKNTTKKVITGDVILVGNSKSESIKSKNNIVYKSKNELVKKYSIYSFLVLIVIFLGMLIFIKIKYLQ